MTLPPEVTLFIDANPVVPTDHLSVADQRRYKQLVADLNFLRFGTRGPAVHAVTDHAVPVAGGHVIARVYRPGPESGLPGHLTLHGGGWWHGSTDDYISEAICRQRSAVAGAVVVALEYRLAPEHPFPTGLNDAYAALGWMVDHAEALGIDPHNISVGGSSAGANLAAAVAIKARDLAGPDLVFQLLEVPALDLTGDTARPAVTGRTERAMFDELMFCVQRYVPPARLRDPMVSPLLAGDLSGLPPAHILTAEFDPLHLEGERYAERLRDAGVDATAVRYPGAIHGSALLTRIWAPAVGWQRDAAEALRQAHREKAAR
jgi:acetyl esterase